MNKNDKYDTYPLGKRQMLSIKNSKSIPIPVSYKEFIRNQAQKKLKKRQLTPELQEMINRRRSNSFYSPVDSQIETSLETRDLTRNPTMRYGTDNFQKSRNINSIPIRNINSIPIRNINSIPIRNISNLEKIKEMRKMKKRELKISPRMVTTNIGLDRPQTLSRPEPRPQTLSRPEPRPQTLSRPEHRPQTLSTRQDRPQTLSTRQDRQGDDERSVIASWSGVKPVIFLDIDGVIFVSKDMYNNDKRVKILTELCLQMNAKIVLSSNHRMSSKRFLSIKKTLNQFGKIFDNDVIPFSGNLLLIDTNDRGRIIEKWLSLNEGHYSTFVIFDDKPENQFKNLASHFVQTKKELGLTIENIEQALEILSR